MKPTQFKNRWNKITFISGHIFFLIIEIVASLFLFLSTTGEFKLLSIVPFFIFFISFSLPGIITFFKYVDSDDFNSLRRERSRTYAGYEIGLRFKNECYDKFSLTLTQTFLPFFLLWLITMTLLQHSK